MDINPDFRTRLRERSGDDTERFQLLPAGDCRMSIQFPKAWLPDLPSTNAPEDCDCWNVAVYTADGTPATPSTHPRIFHDGLWRRYWIDGSGAPSMPTEVVQTLFDFLVLGPERYDEMTR